MKVETRKMILYIDADGDGKYETSADLGEVNILVYSKWERFVAFVKSLYYQVIRLKYI